MPIYEYECASCGHISEFLVHDTSVLTEPECPECGSRNLKRQISLPGIIKKTPLQGKTCCGRSERCESPPCSSTGGKCHRD